MKIALQFSGGKDSVCCLFLLKPMWDDITVYWLNTGDAFPEAILYMEELKKLVPHFVEVVSDQPKYIRFFGHPSEATKTECCGAVMWLPLREAMKRDGVDVIIRGVKQVDKLKGPAKSGDFLDGFRFWHPIDDWTDEDVWAYIKENKLPVIPFYEKASGTLECMSCKVYADLGHAEYMKYREAQDG